MPTLICGSAAAAVGVGYGLKKLETEQLPQAAALSATFFVATLVHIPMPPASVHLLLPGLMGLVLGWGAFPALAIGLLLQYLFFGHGGITTLGVNTINMGVPALVVYFLFGRLANRCRKQHVFVCGFAAGVLGVTLGCLMFSLTLWSSDQGLLKLAGATLAYHLPIALIEGLITGTALGFLRQVRPDILSAPVPAVEG